MSRRSRLSGRPLVALVAAFGAIMAPGCQRSPASPPGGAQAVAATALRAQSSASEGSGAPQTSTAAAHPAFDGNEAFALIQKQCDFGVRPLGSEAHDKLLAYLTQEMKKYADQTISQTFKYRSLPVTNVIGVFYPAGSKTPSAHPVLLLAHWDTRPVADGPYSAERLKGPPYRFGPDGWNRTNPIMGAVDGASGVACLLELARVFKQQPPPVGVVILLDDGEDYGDFSANGGDGEGVELGSRYFAAHYHDYKAFGQPQYGILLDMIGAKDAFFPRETFSQQYAETVNDKVFGVAQSLGYGDLFRSDGTQSVGDDHLALNRAGIPTIDIIDPLPYPPYDSTGYIFWHTLRDTVDKCGVKPVKAVGDVVAAVIYGESAG